MRKNVVFVLDTSGSMGGFKERQMKEAMATILPDLREQDNFGIVFFETTTRSWKEHLVPACKSNIEDAAFAVNYVRARGGWYPCCLLTLGGAEGRMTLPLQNSLTRKCWFLVFYHFWVLTGGVFQFTSVKACMMLRTTIAIGLRMVSLLSPRVQKRYNNYNGLLFVGSKLSILP